jgi:hypothetical protein
MEHGMIVEGELIQNNSKKCFIPFDHSFLMSSLRKTSLGGSVREGGTMSLREGSFKGFLD